VRIAKRNLQEATSLVALQTRGLHQTNTAASVINQAQQVDKALAATKAGTEAITAAE
jgi:hypothetical protein